MQKKLIIFYFFYTCGGKRERDITYNQTTITFTIIIWYAMENAIVAIFVIKLNLIYNYYI